MKLRKSYILVALLVLATFFPAQLTHAQLSGPVDCGAGKEFDPAQGGCVDTPGTTSTGACPTGEKFDPTTFQCYKDTTGGSTNTSQDYTNSNLGNYGDTTNSSGAYGPTDTTGGSNYNYNPNTAPGSSSTGTIQGLFQYALLIINSYVVPLIFAIGFVMFLVGVLQYFILGRGDEEKVAQGRKFLMWSLIGFAVMVSVWGLVNLFVGTLGLGTSNQPNIPTFKVNASS